MMMRLSRKEQPASAVRKKSVFRHNGGLVKDLPYTPLYDSAPMIQRVSGGALNWAPMISRDPSLSDSYTSDRCCFFPVRWRGQRE